MAKANDHIIQAAIEGLEARKQRIDEMIAELRQRTAGGTSAPAPSASAGGRRGMSDAARKRLAELMRKRWAAVKKSGGSRIGAPAAKKAKRQLSPEGRRRIIEATKKRWAAVKAAKK